MLCSPKQAMEWRTVSVYGSGTRSVKIRIADAIRAQILDGTLATGDRLPTEAQLVDEYDVARNTVRDALALLVNEGLIVSQRPRGYFVRGGQRMQYRPQSDLGSRRSGASRDSYLTEQAMAGRQPTQKIEVAIVVPPPEAAQRLALDEGQPAVVRRRVRLLDGEAYHTNDSYFPLELAQATEIMSPVDIDRGANQVLAENGAQQVRARDEIFVRMPTPGEAQRLDLAPGTPVAVHITTGYTADNVPVRVAVNVLPGDRHVIIYDRLATNEPYGPPELADDMDDAGAEDE